MRYNYTAARKATFFCYLIFLFCQSQDTSLGWEWDFLVYMVINVLVIGKFGIIWRIYLMIISLLKVYPRENDHLKLVLKRFIYLFHYTGTYLFTWQSCLRDRDCRMCSQRKIYRGDSSTWREFQQLLWQLKHVFKYWKVIFSFYWLVITLV